MCNSQIGISETPNINFNSNCNSQKIPPNIFIKLKFYLITNYYILIVLKGYYRNISILFSLCKIFRE